MKLQFYVDNFRTLLFPILIDLNNTIFMKSIFEQNNVHIIIQLIFHYQFFNFVKYFLSCRVTEKKMTGIILFSSTFEICDLTRPISRYFQENLHAAGCHH